MRSYREYCPIARTSEILAERWTPLVVRNLLHGCASFSEIARGVPTMSRSLLVRRLQDLERAGVVVKTTGPGRRRSAYVLTEAGQDLAGVIDAMAAWGQRWLELTTEHTDPAFVLWTWSKFYLDESRLPASPVVVEFNFPEERPGNRRYWLVVAEGTAEVCYEDPGDVPDVCVVAKSEAFTRWHIGELEWSDVTKTGAISVTGPRELVRSLPGWNRRAATRS